ncbi:MAG: hypothetical protein QXL18_02395 [Candidatus Woesearchaeota archaeon]
MNSLNENYLKLMALLKNNPRRSFLEISRITGFSVEEVFETYNYLKENKYIKTISLLNIPNFEIINALMFISQTPNQEDIIYFLKRNKSTNAIFLTDREIISFLTFFNLTDYDLFLDSLELFGIDGIDIYFINEVI